MADISKIKNVMKKSTGDTASQDHRGEDFVLTTLDERKPFPGRHCHNQFRRNYSQLIKFVFFFQVLMVEIHMARFLN